jgi:hypothetical protein
MRTLSIVMALFGAGLVIAGTIATLYLGVVTNAMTSDQSGALAFCVSVGIFLMGACGGVAVALRQDHVEEVRKNIRKEPTFN